MQLQDATGTAIKTDASGRIEICGKGTDGAVVINGDGDYDSVLVSGLNSSSQAVPLEVSDSGVARIETSTNIDGVRYMPVAGLEGTALHPIKVGPTGITTVQGSNTDGSLTTAGSAGTAFLQGSEGGDATARGKVMNSLPWYYENLSDPAVWGEATRNSSYRLMVASTAGEPVKLPPPSTSVGSSSIVKKRSSDDDYEHTEMDEFKTIR